MNPFCSGCSKTLAEPKERPVREIDGWKRWFCLACDFERDIRAEAQKLADRLDVYLQQENESGQG